MKLPILILLFAAAIAHAQTPGPAPIRTQQEYTAVESAAILRAGAMYPDATVKDSAFNNALQAAAVKLQKTDPRFFRDPNWPVLLATKVGRSMGIAPRVSFAPPPVRQPVELEIPMVSVRTSTVSRKDVESVTSDGWNQTQTVRSIGALVDYHFFSDRQTPYEIQCFFLAKNDSTKRRYVFDTTLYQSRQKVGKKDFIAAPLNGNATQWLDVPVTGTYVATDGSVGPFTGTLTYTNQTTGSHVEGWIVRFVSGGHVLCVNSNQQFLETLAHQSPGFFDAAADAARKARQTANPSPTP